MTAKEVKAQIRELRREMREIGVKKVSCFNGGIDPVTYRYNSQLFRLSVELDKAQKEEAKP